MVTVYWNNQTIKTSSVTLYEWLCEYRIPLEGIAVAVSNMVISRNDWEKTILKDGDQILVITAVSGGGR